jgi:hypothetical protein
LGRTQTQVVRGGQVGGEQGVLSFLGLLLRNSHPGLDLDLLSLGCPVTELV